MIFNFFNRKDKITSNENQLFLKDEFLLSSDFRKKCIESFLEIYKSTDTQNQYFSFSCLVHNNLPEICLELALNFNENTSSFDQKLTQDELLTSIAYYWAERDDFKKGLDILHLIKNASIKNQKIELYNKYCNSKNEEKRNEEIHSLNNSYDEKILDNKEDLIFFSKPQTQESIIHHLENIFNELENQIKNNKTRESIFGERIGKIVTFLIQKNNLNLCFSIIEKMPSNRSKWVAMKEIAVELSKTKKQEALNYIKGIKDSTIKESAKGSIALQLYKSGYLNEALELISEFNQWQIEKKYKKLLIELLISNNDIVNALKITDETLLLHGCDDLIIIAVYYIKKNEKDKALDLIKYLKNDSDKLNFIGKLMYFERKVNKEPSDFFTFYSWNNLAPEKFRKCESDFWKIYNI